jgi:hypothetical protein
MTQEIFDNTMFHPDDEPERQQWLRQLQIAQARQACVDAERDAAEQDVQVPSPSDSDGEKTLVGAGDVDATVGDIFFDVEDVSNLQALWENAVSDPYPEVGED